MFATLRQEYINLSGENRLNKQENYYVFWRVAIQIFPGSFYIDIKNVSFIAFDRFLAMLRSFLGNWKPDNNNYLYYIGVVF